MPPCGLSLLPGRAAGLGLGWGWGWLGSGWLARLGSGLALLRILAGFRLDLGWISASA